MLALILAWTNFICLNIAGALMIYTYIVSLKPTTREKSHGKKAWDECARWRWYSNACEFIMIANMILWLWFPIPELTWKVHSNPLVGIILGIATAVPCTIGLIKANLDAGSETYGPIKEGTVLQKGIYKYIRHPQTVFEWPLFIAGAFLINALFLVLWWVIYIPIYILIIIPIEESDLAQRFGEAYLQYKKNTGAFFPKIRRKKPHQLNSACIKRI